MPEPIWRPSPERVERALITQFARRRALSEDYNELWRWSVDDLEGFWASIWDFFEIRAHVPYERVLGSREMRPWMRAAQRKRL